MITSKKIIILLSFLNLLFFFPLSSKAQMRIGQYTNEAPLGTWNTIGYSSARSIGMGNIGSAIFSGLSSYSINPALLSYGPLFYLSLNGSSNTTSLYRFGVVNTGVAYTGGKNISISEFLFDSAGLSFRIKNWGVALLAGTIESYNRPKINSDQFINDQLFYNLTSEQSGRLRNINLSLSRKFGEIISFGIGINYVFGEYKKTVQDQWFSPEVTIADSKSQEMKGYFINGGLLLRISSQWNISATFRSPFTKEGQGISLVRFQSSYNGNTDIPLQATSNNKYSIPFTAGIGTSFLFSDKIRAGMDVHFFNWEKLSIEYFDEKINRNFSNTIKINVGIEIDNTFTLFNKRFYTPIRVGFIYDPQPMKDILSQYYCITIGSGVRSGRLSLDFGLLIGKESGSGHGLITQKSIVSLSYQLD